MAPDAVETHEEAKPSAGGQAAPSTPIEGFEQKSPSKGPTLKRPAAASPGKTPMKAALAKNKAKAKRSEEASCRERV